MVEVSKPQVPTNVPASTGDTVIDKPSPTMVFRTATVPAPTAAKAAANATRAGMTYMGKPILLEGAAFHRLVESHRGGGHLTFYDMWGVLLFFGFLAGVTGLMMCIALSR